MDTECRATRRATGVHFDASLITGKTRPRRGIGAGRQSTPPTPGVQRHQPGAGRRRSAGVQSRRAVEIETLRAQAEVEPVKSLAANSPCCTRAAPTSSALTCENVRLALFDKAQQIYLEAGK